jgi:two-component system, LytTR family, response regulator
MYTCLVVDDEQSAVNLLLTYIERTEHLQIKHSTTDPVKAMDLLAVEEYDIVFCDMRMPVVPGIDIIKAYHHKALFIMCTGFVEYAVDGYDYDVVDFLLKPTSYARFMQAVNKALKLLQMSNGSGHKNADYIFLKTIQKGRSEKINHDDIVYIEGQRNYVSIVLKNKKIMVAYRLKDLEEQLPSNKFIRVHLSYIIAISKIQQIEPTGIQLIGVDAVTPIGISYKAAVYTKLGIK